MTTTTNIATPTEVIASATLNGTRKEQVSQKRAAIRAWLATSAADQRNCYTALAPLVESYGLDAAFVALRECLRDWQRTHTPTDCEAAGWADLALDSLDLCRQRMKDARECLQEAQAAGDTP